MPRVAAILQVETKFFTDRKKRPHFLTELEPGKTALDFLFERIRQIRVADQVIVFTSTRPEDDPIVTIAARCGIRVVERFSYDNVKEKRQTYQRHTWGLTSDRGDEYFLGQWFHQYENLKNFDQILYFTPENMLFDPDHVARAFKFHLDGGFEHTFPNQLSKGCYFGIFNTDVIRALNRTDSLRTIRGGVVSAAIKRLYPFKEGVFRDESYRDNYYFNLSFDSHRMVGFFKTSGIHRHRGYAEVKETARRFADQYFDFPRVLHIEPSSRCDFSCVFCPHQKLSRPKSDLDLAVYRKLLKSCEPHDDLVFRFSGFGEPTQHPELLEMIALAADQNITTHLVTSGKDLTVEYVGRLINARTRVVTLSLEGHTPPLYQKFRPEFEFAKFQLHLANLIRIKEMGPDLPNVVLQILKYRGTDPHLLEFMDFWSQRSNNVPEQNFFPFSWRKDSIQWLMVVGASDFLGALPNLEDIDYTPCYRTPCKHECERAMILSDGSLVQCQLDFDGRRPRGNLAASDLAELWNRQDSVERRRWQLAGKWAEIQPCASCTDWYQN